MNEQLLILHSLQPAKRHYVVPEPLTIDSVSRIINKGTPEEGFEELTEQGKVIARYLRALDRFVAVQMAGNEMTIFCNELADWEQLDEEVLVCLKEQFPDRVVKRDLQAIINKIHELAGHLPDDALSKLRRELT